MRRLRLALALALFSCAPALAPAAQCELARELDRALAPSAPRDLPPAARAQPELFALAVERRALACDGAGELDDLRERLAAWSALLGEELPGPALERLALRLAGPDAPATLRGLAELGEAAGRALRDGALELSAALSREAAAACVAAGLEETALQHRLDALARASDANRPDEVLCECERLLPLVDARARPFAHAWIAARLGQASHALGDEARARAVLEPALRVAARHPEPELFLFAAHEAAWTAWGNGRPTDALELFAACRERARACGRAGAESRALRSEAFVRFRLGDRSEALRLFDAAARVAAESGDFRRVCEAEAYRAGLLLGMGRRSEAARALEDAHDLLLFLRDSPRPEDATMLPSLESRILRVEADLALESTPDPLDGELVARIDAALACPTSMHDESRLRWVLVANDLRLGELDRARARADALVRDADGARSAELRTRALTLSGVCALESGEPERALASFEEAARIQEEERAELLDVEVEGQFLKSREAGRLSSLAVAAAAEAHAAGGGRRAALDALYFLDHGRGRTLSRFAGEDAVRRGALGVAPSGRDGMARRLEESLREGELLVAFDLSAAVAVAATRAEVLLYRLPPPEEIERGVDFALHALLDVPDASLYARSAAKLYRALIGPALARFPDARELVVVADGPLHRLPLELLPRGESVEERAELPYLFLDLAVAYVPSLRALGGASRGRRSAGSEAPSLLILAFEDRAELPRLPGAGREAQSIAALFAGAKRLSLRTGAEASEAFLASPAAAGHELLHIASHAWADREAGHRSGIALAPGGGRDGRLTVSELLEMRVDHELVVVSGCEAGEGESLLAEGVLSVGWAFLHAGAGAVLVSAAPVDDDAAARLFVPFYREVIAGADAASALARARRALLEAGDPDALRALSQPFHVVRGL